MSTPWLHTDVCPHGFKRDASCGIIRNDLRHVNVICALVQRLVLQNETVSRTGIAKATLVKTERPIRDLSGSTHDLSVLSRYLSRVRGASSQEVEIEDTSDHIVLQRRGIGVIDLDVHAIRIREEDSVRSSGAMLEVNRMVSIKVRPARNEIRVPRPESTRIIVRGQMERVRVLSKTIHVRIGRQARLHAEILRFEDNGVGNCGEKNFFGLRSENSEREWRCRVRELDVGVVRCNEKVRLRSRKD